MTRPKPRRRLPAEVLPPHEVAALLEACKTATWTARRNRALITLLYRSGLRLGEALSLAHPFSASGTFRPRRGRWARG